MRKLSMADAPFILELLNDAEFIRNIGDRGVRTVADAEKYILEGPVKSYNENGFGLYLVEAKTGAPVGICGLVKRQTLPEVDIGFAFLPQFRGKGFALKAATQTVAEARVKGLKKLLAIISPGNEPSIRLVEKLGMKFDSLVRLTPETDEVKLYAMTLESC